MREKNVWGSYKINGITKDGLSVAAFVYAPNGWAAIAMFEKNSGLKFTNARAASKPTENVWE